MAGNQDGAKPTAGVVAAIGQRWDAGVLCVAIVATAGILLTETPWLSAAVDEPPISKPLAEYSTDELQQAERTEEVAVELLQRPDLAPETALAAVRRLAAIRGTSPAKLLTAWVSQLDHTSSVALQRNLVDVVSQLEPEPKQECCAAAERLATAAVSDVARQTALAVCMTATGDSSAVFASVKPDAEQLVHFLNAVPLVSDNSIQRKAWGDIRPLLDAGTAGSRDNVPESQVQALVLRVIVQWEGDESEKASDAVRLLCSGQSQVAAMEALAALPTGSWPEQHLGQTAAAVIAWLAENPAGAANSAEHITALKLCDKLGPCFVETKRTRFENRLREITQR